MQTLPLNGEWRFREVAPDCDLTDQLGAADWLPAAVPGCVHTDLMAAEKIPDPFYRLNEAAVTWVAERDWLYVRAFDVGESLLAHERIELVCEGLDTFATLLVNGAEIGRTENAFVEHVFDIAGALAVGPNTLAVRFESSDRVCAEREMLSGALPGGPRVYARKPQYATGWDWGPTLPTCGLWRSAFIRAFSTARIDSVFAQAEVVDGAGRLHLAVDLARTNATPLSLNATLALDERTVGEVELHDVGDRAEAVIEVGAPELWWPVGLGEPSLYDLSVRLRDRGDELDVREVRIGFRTCEIEREPDDIGESFILKINGRRLFAKGANWIPADAFASRVTDDKVRRLIEMAVDQNMNMLRVWGGGIYESDAFYDICDEKGILVWQDFMFACADYPDAEWFRDLAADEAEKAVRRLRNHPCIALYCGNNENHWGAEEWGWGDAFHARAIYDELLPAICRRLDPARFYWPGSPYGGPGANAESHGDMHDWSVWHGGPDPAGYLDRRPRFVSEFGFQAFPTMDTILEFAEPEDLVVDGEVMRAHQKCDGGTAKLDAARELFFRRPENFERSVLLSQIVQAEALRTGIEHWRRSKWHTAGALVWQLNDCWPVISWSTVDGALRRKPAYYAVRRAFKPVLVTTHEEDGEIVVSGINDTEHPVAGTLDVEVFDVCGEAHLVHTDGVATPADSACRLCAIPRDGLPDIDPARQFLWITFYSGVYESQATWFFARPKDLDLPEPDITVETETDEFDGETRLRLTAPVFVKGVWLTVPGQDVEFGDNAFDLVPYVSRDVTVALPEGFPPEQLPAALKVIHCNRLGPGS